MAIVKDVTHPQGTSESTYFTHQYEDDTITDTIIGNAATKAANMYYKIEKQEAEKKTKDLSPLIKGASSLISSVQNSPFDMDESEKIDKINSFFETYGRVYSLSDMNSAIKSLGGEELLSASFSGRKADAAKFENEQRELRELGYQINPNAEDDQAARATAYNWLSTQKYIKTGIDSFELAKTDNERAMSLQQITPALIQVSNTEIRNSIDNIGGVHNINSNSIEGLKSQMRTNYLAGGLPGAYVDYLVDRSFYQYEKIAKANDKDKDAAISQLENTKKAMELPEVISLLSSTFPAYAADGTQIKISGAKYKAMVDAVGKDNTPLLVQQLGGVEFIKSFVSSVAYRSTGNIDPVEKAFSKPLGEAAAFLSQKAPKAVNELLYNNPEGSFEQKVGEEVGSDSDDAICSAIDESLGKGTRESSACVRYLNKNKSSSVTPSMTKVKRTKIDQFLDTIAKEYKEVFSGDGAIPMINTETGEARLFEYSSGLGNFYSSMGLGEDVKASVGSEITPSAASKEKGFMASIERLLSPDSVSAQKFYGTEKEALGSALKELARETNYDVKDIYKQYNNAVSRTTGIQPSQIEEAVNSKTEFEKVTAKSSKTREQIKKEAIEEAMKSPDYDDSEVSAPLDSYKVTEKFVKRDVVLTGEAGKAVYAPSNGMIIYSGKAPGKIPGFVTIIQADANPSVTWTLSVKDGALNSEVYPEGTHVSPGDPVSFTGDSGSVRVMLKDGNKYINPLEMFDSGEYTKKIPPVQPMPPEGVRKIPPVPGMKPEKKETVSED